MKKIKSFVIIFLLFLAFLGITVFSYAETISNDLSETFFRLHIIANSDSEEDQALKLKVRDEIINYMNTLNYENLSKDDIIEIFEENSDVLKEIAEKVINENGYNYDVNISIGKFEFPTKYYGNISLPAGIYDALKIEIGDAKGQNWWCSLFPPLCFIDISSGVIDEEGENYLRENLTEEEFTIITSDSQSIKLKFKILELLG